MNLGLLSRAKIEADCSMKLLHFERELYSVFNKKYLCHLYFYNLESNQLIVLALKF